MDGACGRWWLGAVLSIYSRGGLAAADERRTDAAGADGSLVNGVVFDAAADDREARAGGDEEHELADGEAGLEAAALAAQSEDAAGRCRGADALAAPAQPSEAGNHGEPDHGDGNSMVGVPAGY